MARLTYSVREAADALGVCPQKVYELIRDGKVPVLRQFGPRTLRIPKSALAKMCDEATWESAS